MKVSSDTALMQRLREVGTSMSAEDGAPLFAPGDETTAFLLPISGHVRVEQTSPAGRQVVLYRLAPGDSCVITTSCLLSGHPYSAFGYAEGAVTALAIGASNFHKLMADDSDFRTLVLAAFSTRMMELTSVIDDLLLSRIDLKLALWLSNRADSGGLIAMTHQQIATELGSVREVVSRVLKEFEQRGWVRLARGSLVVLRPDELRRLSREAA